MSVWGYRFSDDIVGRASSLGESEGMGGGQTKVWWVFRIRCIVLTWPTTTASANQFLCLAECLNLFIIVWVHWCIWGKSFHLQFSTFCSLSLDLHRFQCKNFLLLVSELKCLCRQDQVNSQTYGFIAHLKLWKQLTWWHRGYPWTKW